MRQAARQFSGGWFDEIPADWRALKIRRLCRVKRGASPRPIDDPVYFDEEGSHGWVRICDVTASNRTLLSTEQRLSELSKSLSVEIRPGELFLSIAGSVGKPIIAGIPCCIHDGFVYFDGLKAVVPEFLYYIFICGRPYAGLGKLGTQLNLNTDTVSDIYIPLPEKSQQRAIVGFLDDKTTLIDDLIAKKQRLIELLDEKRSALISQTVTHGLPGIATQWTAGHLGRFIRLQRGYDITGAEFANGRYPVISSGGPSGFTETPQVKGPGVIVGRKGTVGIVYFCETDYWPHDTTLFVQQFGDSFPRFVYYYLRHLGLKRFDVGAANPTINRNHVHPEPVLWPDRDSQNAIAGYLDNELTKLGEVEPSVKTAIDRLREYRAALITAGVTGQLDIRQHEKKMDALA